jgi:hypothetical protein
MSIDKKRRTLSETITSVDDPIELSQKGQVVLTKTASTYTFIPTTIAKPKSVTIVPHMTKFVRSVSIAATLTPSLYAELNTDGTPESGLKLYSIASNNYKTTIAFSAAKLGHMFINDNKLYRAKTTWASSATIGAVLASDTLKATYLEQIPYTDNVKYIKVLEVTAQTTVAFSFEVKGY